MSSSNNRSAFEAIPGKDALLEYQSRVYPIKTYVERNGLVYKALTATSSTFISSQWELIADLREVRVPNIPSRNALTGNTPTTGTTGIRIPILDNTNVLVLDAFNDPQVAKHEFARYNYNQTNGTWLLLQAGTGATNSNVNDYNLLINKKPIVSGVTVTAGSGLVGGGSVLGTAVAPYAHGGTIVVSHADTSSQASINNSGYAYIQSLRFDTFGHVTGATSSTWVHPSGLTTNVINTGTTYLQSINLSNGHVIGVTSSPWVHPDTSSQASSNNSGNVFIQSIQLDTDGHVIGLNTGTASGSGGGGSPLKYNADFGGVLTMNSGATLTISGGSNIQTFRTGNAANPGLRININPAGLINQIQFNTGSAIPSLSASANLTFTGGTTLVTNKLTVSALPITGATTNDFLVRNPANGNLQALNFSTIERSMIGQPSYSVQYNGLGYFSGSSNFTFTASTRLLKINNGSLVLGNFSGSTPTNSMMIGFGNLSHYTQSLTVGNSNKINATGSVALIVGSSNDLSDNANTKFAFGNGNLLYGANTSVFGYQNTVGRLNAVSATPNNSVFGSTAFGWGNISTGFTTIAIGTYTRADGALSVAMGAGTSTRPLKSSGFGSVNISVNNGSQVLGAGALGDYSGIFGGLNNGISQVSSIAYIYGGNLNKIDTNGGYNSILGGSSNLLTGSTLNSTIIGGTLHTVGGLGGYNSILGGYNHTILGGGIGNGSLYYMTIAGGATNKIANSAGTFIGGGFSNLISGTTAAPNALYSSIIAGQQNSISQSKSASIIGGQINNISSTSDYSTIVGTTNGVITASTYSSIHGGFNNKIFNTVQSLILGGSTNKINGAQRAAIIGGTNITLSGGSQTDNVVVPNLMIWNTPGAGASDDLLTWNATTRKINRVTQASVKTAPAGSTNQIQLNNGGAFAARPDFYFDQSFGAGNSLLYLGTVSPSTYAFMQFGNQAAVGNSSALLLEGKSASSNLQIALKSNIAGALSGGQVNQITASGDMEIYAGSNLYIGNFNPGTNNIILKNLPTSATGLPSGAIWRNGTVINIVP